MLRSLCFATCILALVGCVGDPGAGGAALDNSTPDAAISSSVAALKANDIAGFVASAIPPESQSEAEAAWNEERTAPVDEQEAAQFNMMMTQLTADGAEQTLLTMIKPQLPEAQQQMQMAAGLVTMLAAGAMDNAELTDAEKQQSQAMVSAIGQWLTTIDLTDEAKVSEAIGIACATARDLGVPNHEALRALSYDQMLGKGGQALGGVKQILALYGLDIDATLDSIEVGEPAVDGDTAKVPVSVSILGQTQTTTAVLQQIDGKWFGEPPADDAGAPTME